MSQEQIVYFSDISSEFITREMGWRIASKSEIPYDSLSESKVSGALIIAIGSNRRELEVLRSLPYKSVFVHLYSDETYDPVLNFLLLREKAVRAVIRSYPVRNLSIFQLEKLFLKSILRNFEFDYLLNFVMFFASILAGQVMILRQYFIKILEEKNDIHSIDFVPGYTNLFARTLVEHFNLTGDSDSLLTSERFIEITEVSERKFLVSFIGQRGKFWRGVAIDEALKLESKDKIKFRIRKKFGGTLGANGASQSTATEYIEGLIHSDFSLCPSGNYSGNTFRYLESVICGSIPIISDGIPSDPGYKSIFGPPETCREVPWRSLLGQLQIFSKLERREMLINSRLKAVHFLQNVTKEISKANLS